MLGFADFPLLLSIKIKLLYDIAVIYGFDVKNYMEKIYILNIFQLAFSSQEHINKVFHRVQYWDAYVNGLSSDINSLDWREFQEPYRDYIDLAKFLQMVPWIGAFVCAYLNNKIVDRLSKTAIQAYRMRVL